MTDSSEVKLHFLDYWRIVKVRAGLISLAFLLVMITAGVTTYFLPRQYFSKVTMEVKPDRSNVLGTIFSGDARNANDPTFIPTQFQNLQKTDTLDPVIQNLKLLDAWKGTDGKQPPMQVARAKLLKMLQLREVRNTTHIEIGVFDTDAQEGANIANTIALVYRENRVAEIQRNIDRGLAQLREEVEKQRKRVEEANREMVKIRQRDAIIDPDPENANSSISTADRNLAALDQQRNEQRLVVTKTEGNLHQITKLKPGELKEALRTLNIEDASISKMVSSLQDALSKEAELRASGLGERHPAVGALQSMRAVYEEQLSDSLNSVRANLATKLEIEKSTLEAIEEKFRTASKEHISDNEKATAYQEAKSTYLQAKKIFEIAQGKYSTELLERGIDFEPAKIREKAEAAIYPAKPNVPMYMALAAFIGLVVGVGLAFFIEYLDTSVKTLDDVEKYLQIPVLAVIPKGVETLIKRTGDSRDAESYRILRANVEFNKPDRNARTYTLVSGGPGEGKSTTLNNLAFTCAQGGYNVLVVDADLRRPTQHYFFEVPNDIGLTDYLTGKVPLDEVVRTTKIDNLSFVPSGKLPGEAVGILNSQRMVDLIAKVKGQYDLVFFDAPPILGVSDGSVLSSECDITIMVVQHRRFPRAMLQRVKQAVAHAGGTLIGVVLNQVDTKHDEGYGYYGGYSDYYAAAQQKAPATPVRVAPPAPAGAGAAVRPRPDTGGDY